MRTLIKIFNCIACKNQGNNIRDKHINLQKMHVHDLLISHRCLLNKKAKPVMKVITDIFGLILKFRNQLVSQPWNSHIGAGDGQVQHPGFLDMCATYTSFQEYSVFLFRGTYSHSSFQIGTDYINCSVNNLFASTLLGTET